MARIFYLISLFTACCFITSSPKLYCQQNPEGNKLIINSLPEGASVIINDKYCGLTPYTQEDVKNQPTKIKVTLNDYTRIQNLSAIAGTYKMFFIMDGDYGILDLNTSPAGANVFIDDSLRGQAPLSDLKLPQGSHKLKVVKEDYDIVERRINVYSMKYDYNLKLEKKYGFISIRNGQLRELKIDGSLAQKGINNEYRIEKGKRSLGVLPMEFNSEISGNFNIEGGTHYELQADYNYFTPKYFLLSAVVPGLGQIFDKSGIKGSAYLAGTLLCGAAYFKVNADHKAKLDEYELDREKYNAAQNEPDAIKYRALMESKISEINKYAKLKGIFLSSALGIYLLNIADAIIFHTNGSDIELRKLIDIDTQNNRLGFKIKLN